MLFFSTDDRDYQRWQAELLVRSAVRVGQADRIHQAVATRSAAAYRPIAGVTAHPHWPGSPRPATGDAYPPYNKAVGAVAVLSETEGPDDEPIHALDPDMILRAPLLDRPTPGRPIGQPWSYMDPNGYGRRYLEPLGLDPERVDPVGFPISITRGDLSRVAVGWLEAIERVRGLPGGRSDWVAEMWGYVIAAAEAGLRHRIVDRMIVPLDHHRAEKPIVHYCYPMTTTSGREIWTKFLERAWARLPEPTEPLLGGSAQTLEALRGVVFKGGSEPEPEAETQQGAVGRRGRPTKRNDLIDEGGRRR